MISGCGVLHTQNKGRYTHICIYTEREREREPARGEEFTVKSVCEHNPSHCLEPPHLKVQASYLATDEAFLFLEQTGDFAATFALAAVCVRLGDMMTRGRQVDEQADSEEMKVMKGELFQQFFSQPLPGKCFSILSTHMPTRSPQAPPLPANLFTYART